jgi:hypothetical protein
MAMVVGLEVTAAAAAGAAKREGTAGALGGPVGPKAGGWVAAASAGEVRASAVRVAVEVAVEVAAQGPVAAAAVAAERGEGAGASGGF